MATTREPANKEKHCRSPSRQRQSQVVYMLIIFVTIGVKLRPNNLRPIDYPIRPKAFDCRPLFQLIADCASLPFRCSAARTWPIRFWRPFRINFTGADSFHGEYFNF